MTPTTITDQISNPTLNLIGLSAGLVIVTSSAEVVAWQVIPSRIWNGGFTEHSKFEEVFAGDRNGSSYQEAVRVARGILAEAIRVFGPQVCLGKFVSREKVHRIGFGHVGWYETGSIPAGEIRVV